MSYQPKINNTQQYSDRQGKHIVHPAKLLFLVEQSPIWEEGALYREVDTNRIFRGNASNTGVQRNSTFERLIPIIISETEEIKVGDKVYHEELGIGTCNHSSTINCMVVFDDYDYSDNPAYEYHNIDPSEVTKVLTLPEHFSSKHLQAIADGKMKDGDEVLIKVDDEKRKLLLQESITKLAMVDNLGDKNCHTCSGHGCVDQGSMWGCIMEHCSDCYPPKIYLDKQNQVTLFPAKQSLEDARTQSWDSAQK